VGECFFWYRPTRVVPDQRPLNGCVCVVKFGPLTIVQAYIDTSITPTYNNNNNNNSHDNVYGAVIMTKVIARVHPVHLMNVD